MKQEEADQMRQEITLFFREFTLRVLRGANVDVNDTRAFKMTMVDHYEEIYPQFSLTPVFQAHNNKDGHQQMVDEYRRCFSLLLVGRLP